MLIISKFIYSLMLYCLLPWVLLRLWLRGLHVPEYRQNWLERFGRCNGKFPSQPIWVHAVSVGEVRAAEPLINALLNLQPVPDILMTTTTPTGRSTITQLFGERVACAYLPYDLPGSVRCFLQRVCPRIAIVMETEIWPNLYRALHQREIPLLLVNARLSEKSFIRYRRFKRLSRYTLGSVSWLAAQSDEDANRFHKLGVADANIQVVGNLKFDARLPLDYRERVASARQITGERMIWVAGSTHPGEDELILSAHGKVLKKYPQALLVIAPRHPERSADVVADVERSGLRGALVSQVVTRASSAEPSEAEQVLVLDALGQLWAFYGVAKVAFVSGSLVPAGGHNPIEPLLSGVPVISGMHTDNFSEIYQHLEKVGAASIVRNAGELADSVYALLESVALREQAAKAGKAAVEKNRRALQVIMERLETENMR